MGDFKDLWETWKWIIYMMGIIVGWKLFQVVCRYLDTI